MAEVQVSQDVVEGLLSNPEEKVSQDVIEYLFTEFLVPELQVSQDVIEYIFSSERAPVPETPNAVCNFVTLFTPGVVKQQVICQ